MHGLLVLAWISQQREKMMTLKITSPAFEDGAPMAAKYTCEGSDIAPPLQFSDAALRVYGHPGP